MPPKQNTTSSKKNKGPKTIYDSLPHSHLCQLLKERDAQIKDLIRQINDETEQEEELLDHLQELLIKDYKKSKKFNQKESGRRRQRDEDDEDDGEDEDDDEEGKNGGECPIKLQRKKNRFKFRLPDTLPVTRQNLALYNFIQSLKDASDAGVRVSVVMNWLLHPEKFMNNAKAQKGLFSILPPRCVALIKNDGVEEEEQGEEEEEEHAHDEEDCD